MFDEGTLIPPAVPLRLCLDGVLYKAEVEEEDTLVLRDAGEFSS